MVESVGGEAAVAGAVGMGMVPAITHTMVPDMVVTPAVAGEMAASVS